MTVDLRALPWSVLVNNGTDSLDCSSIRQTLELSSNTFDPSGWVKFTGTLRLAAFVDGFAESCDPRLNPNRWKPGNVVSISIDFGSPTGVLPLPWRLKILAWPNRPWPGNPYIDIALGGDATLLDYRTPEGDAGGVTYGTSTDRDALINAYLTAAGAPALTDAINVYPLSFSPEKKSGGSWISQAGVAAYTANRVLWQQANGSVRAATLTLDGLAPIAHYTIGTNEVAYEPGSVTGAPPELVRCVGTTYELTPVADSDTTTSETINGRPVTTRLQYSGRTSNAPTLIETRTEQAGSILPTQYPGSTTTVISYRSTKTEHYDPTTLRLDGQETLIERPAGLVHPAVAFNNPSALIPESRTTEELTYDAADNIIERVTTIEKSALSGLTVSLFTATVIREKWSSAGGDEWNYTRFVSNSAPDPQANPSRSVPPSGGSGNKPPAARYRPAEQQRTEREFSATVRFSSPAATGYAEKLQVITLPGGFGVSVAQCEAIATLWGRIRHGRQFPLTWAGDLTPAWLQSFTPVRRIDFTLNGVRTAYLVEALSLTLTETEASIGGSALELGTVNADGSGVPNPPYSYSTVI